LLRHPTPLITETIYTHDSEQYQQKEQYEAQKFAPKFDPNFDPNFKNKTDKDNKKSS
jgi:hypothetical protein